MMLPQDFHSSPLQFATPKLSGNRDHTHIQTNCERKNPSSLENATDIGFCGCVLLGRSAGMDGVTHTTNTYHHVGFQESADEDTPRLT